MSKQERTKWKNKYKLWKTLHPDENYPDNSCSICMGMKKCVNMKTMAYDTNKDIVRILCDRTIKRTNGICCIEWIKHV